MPALETSFFLNGDYRKNDVATLGRELRDAPSNALLGIKHSEYFGQPECPQRIAQELPGAKLIVKLRNPVDRALSQYFHDIRSGRLVYADPDKALAAFLAGDFPERYVEQRILWFGLYAKSLTLYLDYFSSENVLLLTDLDSAETNYRKACDFLGIKVDPLPTNFAVPRNQGVYSAALLRIIGGLNRQCYIFDSVSGSATHRNNLSANVKSGCAKLLVRGSALARFAGLLSPTRLSTKIRARLLDYYLPDIERLEAFIHRDLSQWKRLPS